MNAAPRYATALFRSIWCFSSTMISYYLFHHFNFWPWYVGGNGMTKNCWNLNGSVTFMGMSRYDDDFDHSNKILKRYFIIQTCYHWHSGCFHIWSIIVLFIQYYKQQRQQQQQVQQKQQIHDNRKHHYHTKPSKRHGKTKPKRDGYETITTSGTTGGGDHRHDTMNNTSTDPTVTLMAVSDDHDSIFDDDIDYDDDRDDGVDDYYSHDEDERKQQKHLHHHHHHHSSTKQSREKGLHPTNVMPKQTSPYRLVWWSISSKSHLRSFAQHSSALMVMFCVYTFSSLRRLGAIGMFSYDVCNLFLHILQLCMNAPYEYHILRSTYFIRIVYWLGVLPTFIMTRFVIWTMLYYSSIYESYHWLSQLDNTIYVGSSRILRIIFHLWILLIQYLNIIYLLRLWNHPHLRQLLLSSSSTSTSTSSSSPLSTSSPSHAISAPKHHRKQ